MPIYEFKCTKCGAKFEELLAGCDDVNVTCPSCGGHEAKRLVSAFGYSGSSGFRSSAAGSGGCGSCGGGSCSTCH